MMKKSYKKNFIYNFCYQIVALIFPLLTTPYVSRVMGIDAIGEYSYTYSIASYFVLLVNYGFHVNGQRKIAYVQDDIKRRTEVFIETMLLKILMAMLSIVLYFFIISKVSMYQITFLAQMLYIVAAIFDISWFFQGMEDFKITVFRNIVIKTIGTMLIFAFVKSSSDLNLYILCLAGSTLLGNITLWIGLPKFVCSNVRPKMRELGVIFTQSTQLFVPIIAIQIYSIIDKTMLGMMTGSTTENGYYEQSQRILKLLMSLASALGIVLLPHISNLYSQGKNKEIKDIVDNSIRLIIGIISPVVIGIIAISDNFIPVFLGSNYMKSAILLKILVPIVLISGIANIIGNAILIPLNRHNKATLATILGAFINVVLNLYFIPHWNSVGAAITSVIAEFIVLVVQAYFARDYFSIKGIVVALKRYVSLSMIMGVCVFVFKSLCVNMNNVIILIAGIIIGIVTYLVELFICKDELWNLLKKFKIGHIKDN